MNTPPDPSLRHPLLGLGDAVLFPGDVLTATIRGAENLAGLKAATEAEGVCIAVALRDPKITTLRPDDLFEIGTLARVVSRRKLADGSAKVVLQGLRRVCLDAVAGEKNGLAAGIRPLPESTVATHGKRELARMLVRLRAIAASNPSTQSEIEGLIPLYGEDPERITDLAAIALPLEYRDRALLLNEPDPLGRVARLSRLLSEESIRVRAGEAVDVAVARRIRQSYLGEKLAVLRAELGEVDPHAEETEEIERRIEAAPLPVAAKRKARRELRHLLRATPGSAEYGRVRDYLEWMLELPWDVARPGAATLPPPPEPSLSRMARILEKSHVGLDPVKERLVEYLATHRLGGGKRGTVLCFVGPPGTGKSSMGRTVAAALGRPFLTIPVGAKTQEREICGAPYRVASGMPGAILTGLHRCGARNPVILLDEIDKLSLGGEGASAGALLQLLDPERNGEFLDHYLGVPFDLSPCLLLATANDPEEIPEALLDRMEAIEFSGYSESEKLEIARRHILTRARAQAGVSGKQFKISPAALRALIRGYTEEAGVRDLERRLVALARKAAVRVVKEREGISVGKADLVELLGPRTVDEDLQRRRAAVGTATGLAWTSVGGALLPIESIMVPGSGRMILTGQIGEVLRESVQTAISYLRTRFDDYGLAANALDSVDLHLHFPSGATPKDGPSAGVAIAAALVSLLTGRPSRHDLAMTGEMSLLGHVLPVGGIREKLLAAIRTGIPEVAVPERNAEEVVRLSADIRGQLTIHLIGEVSEAFGLALMPPGPSRRTPRSAPAAHPQVARRARARRRGGEHAG